MFIKYLFFHLTLYLSQVVHKRPKKSKIIIYINFIISYRHKQFEFKQNYIFKL